MIGYDMVVNPAAGISTLTALGAKVDNMRPVFVSVRDLMLKDQRRNFDQRGGVFGAKWRGTSPETMERKHNREGQPGSILTATGELATAARGGKGKFTRITKSQVRVGINKRIFYARFHQAGAPQGSRRGVLPKRELVGIAPATRRTSLDLIARYLSS